MEKMNIIPWEIVTGCERLSPGCDNCPTYWSHKKLGKDYHPKIQPFNLEDPVSNKDPSVYIVAPGSDLFHEAVKLDYIKYAFDVMNKANWHQYEVGTKRIERMAMLSNKHLSWGDHMIALTGVEEAKYRWRIDTLREIDARRMVMFGPMSGRVGEVDLEGIEVAGVVVEDFGPNPRVIPEDWVYELNYQCHVQGVRLSDQEWVCADENIKVGYSNKEVFL